jgi:transposase
MSKPRDPDKEQFWRQTLAAWQDSGLSVTAFCQQRQLQLQSFFRWRKLLAQRDQPAAASAETTVPPASLAAAAPAFLPVRVRHRPSDPGHHPFEVVLAGGRLLRVATAFDPAALRQLLDVLEQSPC